VAVIHEHGGQRVFLCYSRGQFHAAEQVAALLARQGFDVWFDVQRLAAGDDWTRAVEEAVDHADVLVLLASPQALASPYPQREWRRAQRAGTPVLVAVVDAVALPAELAGVPAVDVRRRFEDGVAALGRIIAGDRARPGVPHPSRPRRPAAMAVVTAALVIDLVAVLGSLLVYPVEILMVGIDWSGAEPLQVVRAVMAPAVGGLFAGYLWQVQRQFRRRQARFAPLWIALLLAVPFFQFAANLLNTVVAALAHGVDWNLLLTDAESELSGGYYVIATLLLLPLNVAALGSLLLSRSTFRWLPAGEAPQWLRRRALRDAPDRRPRHRALRSTRTAVVHHAPADAAMARQVAAAFAAGGLEIVERDAELQVVLVTNATDWPWAARLLASGRSVAVIGSSVRPPEGAEDLERLQWLDFRDGDADGLGRRVAWLAGTQPGPPARPPHALDRFAGPAPVRRALLALRVLAAVFGASALLSMTVVAPDAYSRNTDYSQPVHVAGERIPGTFATYARLNPDRVRDTAPAADTLLVVRAGLAAALCLLLIVMAWRLGVRRLSRGGLAALAGVVLVLAAAWMMLGVASEEPPPLFLAGYVVGATVAVFLTGLGWRRIAGWLPLAAASGRSTLRPVGPGWLHVSLPLTMLILTPLYISGTIL